MILRPIFCFKDRKNTRWLIFNPLKQKKFIINFFVNRNWKKLTDSRKRAQILADNRKPPPRWDPPSRVSERVERAFQAADEGLFRNSNSPMITCAFNVQHFTQSKKMNTSAERLLCFIREAMNFLCNEQYSQDDFGNYFAVEFWISPPYFTK